jgi:hypothetical protein
MAHEVFISYAKDDGQAADIVCRALEAEGIGCWYAPRDVPPGAVFEDAIVTAISASRLMLLILSAHALGSRFVMRECAYADDEGVTVLPLRIEDVRPGGALKLYIGSVQWLDALTPPLESHLERLINSVRVRLQEAAAERQRAQEEAARKQAAAEARSRLAQEEAARRAEEEQQQQEEDEKQRQAAEAGRLEEVERQRRIEQLIAGVRAEEEAQQRARAQQLVEAERIPKEEPPSRQEAAAGRALKQEESAPVAADAERRRLEAEGEREGAAEIAARPKEGKKRLTALARLKAEMAEINGLLIIGALALAASAIVLTAVWLSKKNSYTGERQQQSQVQDESASVNNAGSQPGPTATLSPSIQQNLTAAKDSNNQPGPTVAPSVTPPANVHSDARPQPANDNSADANKPSERQTKNITPLQTSDSKIVIRSDEPLNDYSAYRSGDRYYVVIPQANKPGVPKGTAGYYYDDVRAEKHGSDTVISFRLQHGARPHVNQRFNRLEVDFGPSSPGPTP